MGRRENRVYQQNATRGAVTRWCPRCQRSAALSAVQGAVAWTPAGPVPHLWRTCRYCGLQVKEGGKHGAARRRRYEEWRREQRSRRAG